MRSTSSKDADARASVDSRDGGLAPTRQTLATGQIAPKERPGAPRAEGNETIHPRGACIDRYVIIEHLKSGGMGAVYRAVDPDLNRQVALKLVSARKSPAGEDASLMQERLLREAQGLARLSHPNVVPVFDVGTVDGEVFLAMEFVEGQTLREWLRTPRSYRAIIEAIAAAGEGLAAAHRAGLVHRDFILVGTDGRVRVVDFGLVRPADGDDQDSAARADDLARVSALGTIDDANLESDDRWLLIEWPQNAAKPTKYWLSTLPATTSRRRLAYLAKLRWRIERDYQEMKGELGLDHFEGRTWNGFHHHCACVAAAHAFLTLERALFPPEQRKTHPASVPGSASTGPASDHRPVSAL